MIGYVIGIGTIDENVYVPFSIMFLYGPCNGKFGCICQAKQHIGFTLTILNFFLALGIIEKEV